MKYRIEWTQELEIDSADLIEAFPKEWADAQERGLDEDAFAHECFAVCDWDSLVDLGLSGIDNFDVIELSPSG